MKKPAWLFLFVLTIAATGVLAFFWAVATDRPTPPSDETAAADTARKPEQDQPIVTYIDPIGGNPDGKILIVEYGDYVCPFCREAESAVTRLLASRDDIKYVWKDLPNPNHLGADLAAEAGLCAKDQGKFWEFRKELIGGPATFDESALNVLANSFGLDPYRFSSCLKTRSTQAVVQRNIEEAKALGIDGTPYFFIDGKRHSGLITYEQLEKAVGK
jgi:protein-disulfide isomerase